MDTPKLVRTIFVLALALGPRAATAQDPAQDPGVALPKTGAPDIEGLAKPTGVDLPTRDGRATAARVALHADGGWLVVEGRKYWSHRLPSRMFRTLDDLASAGKAFDAVELGPKGVWAVVAGGRHAEGGLPDSARYHAAIEGLLAGEAQVRAVAFDPSSDPADPGFVIAHEGGFEAHGVPAALRAALEEAAGGVDAVAFTADGGWTVVAGARHWAKGAPEAFTEKLEALEANAQRVTAIAFDPRPKGRGWLILTETDVAHRGLGKELRRMLAARYGD